MRFARRGLLRPSAFGRWRLVAVILAASIAAPSFLSACASGDDARTSRVDGVVGRRLDGDKYEVRGTTSGGETKASFDKASAELERKVFARAGAIALENKRDYFSVIEGRLRAFQIVSPNRPRSPRHPEVTYTVELRRTPTDAPAGVAVFDAAKAASGAGAQSSRVR